MSLSGKAGYDNHDCVRPTFLSIGGRGEWQNPVRKTYVWLIYQGQRPCHQGHNVMLFSTGTTVVVERISNKDSGM
jgi:hypothetical protein